MTERQTSLKKFVEECGYDTATLKLIAGDASNRKYYRVNTEEGCRIVMDAPPDKGEDTRPFVRIARWLVDQDLSAPQIFQTDEDQGFLVLEDLGDAIFARLLEKKPKLENVLYRTAADVLLHIHRAAPPDLPVYSADMMAELATFSCVWYRTGVLGVEASDVAEEFRAVMRDHLQLTNDMPRVLIQRDYHAENLIWLPERAGLARVGLLDFQDAMLGHPAYDLVSVLQDARRDVGADVQDAILQYFQKQSSAGMNFLHIYRLLGLQRNLRILGVFARLCIRDGKSSYVDLIPRVWGHIQNNLSALDDLQLSRLVRDHLPEPTLDNLSILKAKCA